jgi:hypothetical protein
MEYFDQRSSKIKNGPVGRRRECQQTARGGVQRSGKEYIPRRRRPAQRSDLLDQRRRGLECVAGASSRSQAVGHGDGGSRAATWRPYNGGDDWPKDAGQNSGDVPFRKKARAVPCNTDSRRWRIGHMNLEALRWAILGA